MMKNLLLVFLLPFLFIACSNGGDVEITFNISNKKNNEIKLYLLNKEYKLKVDESGRSVKKLYVPKKTYAYVSYQNRPFTVFLTPNKNIDVSLDANDRTGRVFLYCDDNGINSYLATERNLAYESGYASTHLDENIYLKKLEDKISEKREFLRNEYLPEDFVSLEKERIAYNVLEDIFFYPVYKRFFSKNKDYVASERYNTYIDSMFVQRPELLVLKSYQDFLIRYVEKKSLKKRTKENNISTVMNKVNYVLENVHSQEISDFLIHQFVFPFIKHKGIKENERVLDLYIKKIKDKTYKNQIVNLVNRYKNIEKGNPSPDFSFQDLNGNAVSLNDLKGKYVYIDIWATWSGPCRNELTCFQNLTNEYKDKNIYFVGVSIDDNCKRWKRYIEKHAVKGLQLYAGQDDSFSHDYVINSIPRFILLDKNGVICNSNAERPSSERIRTIINKLPGI